MMFLASVNIELLLGIITIVFQVIILGLGTFTSIMTYNKSNKTSVMSSKRGDRLEKLRKNSSDIISFSKVIIYNVGDLDKNKYSLILSENKFNSILQYVYEDDVILINLVKKILDSILNVESINKEEVVNMLNEFWIRCDLYIGIEFERLKEEATGKITRSGDPSFDLYTHIKKEVLLQQKKVHNCKEEYKAIYEKIEKECQK